MSSDGFQFKQFFVRHDRCAMKVGTDGVLLGAWTPVPATIREIREIRTAQVPRILDIGTGSGLIALMLAQRCPEAQIAAIDIDPDAVSQARDNFAASPWSDRLHVAQCALQDLSSCSEASCSTASCSTASCSTASYNLIVCNPPYFVNSLKAPDAARCVARHNDQLPFAELIAESANLLAPEGLLALIVPVEAEQQLQSLAAEHGLQCVRRCYVHPKPERPAKRVMIAWQRDIRPIPEIRTEQLTLEDDHGSRSLDYQLLTRDFYL